MSKCQLLSYRIKIKVTNHKSQPCPERLVLSEVEVSEGSQACPERLVLSGAEAREG